MSKDFELITKMMDYENKNAERIQHFIKVYELASLIGEGEGVSDRMMHLLRTAAIVHDIGIRPSLEKYGDCIGTHQETEGPEPARQMLEELAYEPEIIDRVCYLVAHHHTYTNIDGMDYQILIEADFLVNMFENQMDQESCRSIYERVFRTTTGKRICRRMYSVRD